MHKLHTSLAATALLLVARTATAQSCMSAEECPSNSDCIRGECQVTTPQPAPSQPESSPQQTSAQPATAQPATAPVYVAPGPAYAPVPPPPETLPVGQRPQHFEFGINIGAIWVPPGSTAFFPYVTLGLRNQRFDARVAIGYLHTHSHETEGNGLVVVLDPRLWFGPYGIGATVGIAEMDFSQNTSAGWAGLSTGIVLLATPLSLQFGQGSVRFETAVRAGIYYFPDRSPSHAALSAFGFISVGLVFG